VKPGCNQAEFSKEGDDSNWAVLPMMMISSGTLCSSAIRIGLDLSALR
jgi:hypothetical protein